MRVWVTAICITEIGAVRERENESFELEGVIERDR